MAPSGDDSVSKSHYSEGPCVHRSQPSGGRPILERLNLGTTEIRAPPRPPVRIVRPSGLIATAAPASSSPNSNVDFRGINSLPQPERLKRITRSISGKPARIANSSPLHIHNNP